MPAQQSIDQADSPLRRRMRGVSNGSEAVEPGSPQDLARGRLVVLGVLLLAQNSTVLAPDMDSYAVVDQRTNALRVAAAPCSWTRVTDVAETPVAVRIRVETWPCPIPLPGTADLVAKDLTVSLATDLASRFVEDADGQAIRSR